MSILFLSHSSEDRRLAKQVHDGLADRGLEAVFLDFDADRGIPAGRDWERELYLRLRQSDAVLFIGTKASVASVWCFAELALARAMGKAVYPLGEIHPLLRDTQAIPLNGPVSPVLDRLWERLDGDRITGHGGWDPHRWPYPGLRSFGAEEAAVFYGRDEEIRRVVDQLRPSALSARRVALVGPSGSGKSSLAGAGVVPALPTVQEPWTIIPPFTPGELPVDALAGALCRILPGADWHDVSHRLHTSDASLAEFVREAAAGRPERTRLLVIDQAEDLVTVSAADERDRFVTLLAAALDGPAAPALLLTLRSESLSDFQRDVRLGRLVDHVVSIGPLDDSRLQEVIAAPAEHAALEFEPGLVGRIAADAAGGDALPLLAYTLQVLEGQVAGRRTITGSDYVAVGGVVGAITNRANQVREALEQEGLGAAVLPTLLQLVHLEPDMPAARRYVPVDKLDERALPVVDRFVEERLLTRSTRADRTVVHVTHEALLRQWRPLAAAIRAQATDLTARVELQEVARDWDRAGRDPDYLLDGGRLERAERLLAGPLGATVTDAARAIVEASRASADERRRREARRASSARWAKRLAIVGVMVAAAVLGVLLQREQSARREADRQELLATVRGAAGQAQAQNLRTADTGALVAREAFLLARRSGAPATSAADALVATAAGLTRRLLPLDDTSYAVAFSSDGRWLAAGGSEGPIRLWQAGAPARPPLVLRDHPSQVFGLAFSPDGRTLASGGHDGVVRVWDLRRPGAPPRRLSGHGIWVRAVAFSPDGRTLVSGGEDGTIRLWPIGGGSPTVISGAGKVTGLALDPSGARLAASTREGPVRLFALGPRPHELRRLEASREYAWTVDWSRAGLVAAGSYDSVVRVWDPDTGRLRARLNCLDSPGDVAFAPSGATLACGTSRRVLLWDVAHLRRPPRVLLGPTSEVGGVAFSPSGDRVAAGSYDGVHVWDLEPPRGAVETLPHPTGVNLVYDVDFSEDGRRLAVASQDGRARLWPVHGARVPPAVLAGAPADAVVGVRFLESGGVLTASASGWIRRWDDAGHRESAARIGAEVGAMAATGDGSVVAVASGAGIIVADRSGLEHTRRLDVHTDRVDALALDARGRRLVSAGLDGDVVTTNLADGESASFGVGDFVTALAVTADGSRAAAGTLSGRAITWDPAHPGQRKAVRVYEDPVRALAFSPDGRLLAMTADGDNPDVTVRDAAAPERELQRATLDDVGLDLDVSPDGRRLAVGGRGGDVQVLAVAPALADNVCSIVWRNLSHAEWRRLISPTLPYERTCPKLPEGSRQ